VISADRHQEGHPAIKFASEKHSVVLYAVEALEGKLYKREDVDC